MRCEGGWGGVPTHVTPLYLYKPHPFMRQIRSYRKPYNVSHIITHTVFNATLVRLCVSPGCPESSWRNILLTAERKWFKKPEVAQGTESPPRIEQNCVWMNGKKESVCLFLGLVPCIILGPSTHQHESGCRLISAIYEQPTSTRHISGQLLERFSTVNIYRPNACEQVCL